MKAQMKFQKWMCLVMLIVGAIALLYAFCYMSGALSELGYCINQVGANRASRFVARSGYNNALLYDEIQPFNTMMMYCGIAMVLLAVVLYITACHRRRNYYISNYVATGLCAGGNIIMSLILIIMNASWRSEFLKVDFDAWKRLFDDPLMTYHYNDSTAWFDLGFAVYVLIIVVSVLLILNLVWKIMLMKGEKKLLLNGELAGGETV